MSQMLTSPDLYTPVELTEAVNKLPLMPQRLRPLFTQRSVKTTNVALDIKRLVEIQSFRGTRHRKNLPCRGQRTKTNARTCKGPKRTVANKKK